MREIDMRYLVICLAVITLNKHTTCSIDSLYDTGVYDNVRVLTAEYWVRLKSEHWWYSEFLEKYSNLWFLMLEGTHYTFLGSKMPGDKVDFLLYRL